MLGLRRLKLDVIWLVIAVQDDATADRWLLAAFVAPPETNVTLLQSSTLPSISVHRMHKRAVQRLK